jgi:hypothetical protein
MNYQKMARAVPRGLAVPTEGSPGAKWVADIIDNIETDWLGDDGDPAYRDVTDLLPTEMSAEAAWYIAADLHAWRGDWDHFTEVQVPVDPIDPHSGTESRLVLPSHPRDVAHELLHPIARQIAQAAADRVKAEWDAEHPEEDDDE